MTESTSVAARRRKNPPASGPVASHAAVGRGLRTRIAGGEAATDGGPPEFRMGNCESVASGTRRDAAGGGGAGSGAGGSGGGGWSSGGRSVTPELWTAASAEAATTGGTESPRDAASSTLRNRSAAEISSGDGCAGAAGSGPASPDPGRSSAAEGVRSAVFSTGPVGSRSRYSMAAAPIWTRSPLLRTVSFRMRRPATNVPFEEFRSLRIAVPFASVTSAWLRETDSWSTRTVQERLRPSVTSPSESSISRPSTTRT